MSQFILKKVYYHIKHLEVRAGLDKLKVADFCFLYEKRVWVDLQTSPFFLILLFLYTFKKNDCNAYAPAR